MKQKFTQTVAAALSETSSKFALAEALATEIPYRKPGPRLVGDERGGLTEVLKDVRQEIIDAGGEERTIRLLGEYRLTALWVRGDGKVFRWVKGASFSAHLEARNGGLSLEEFADLDPGDRRVNRIRAAAGWVRTEASERQESSHSQDTAGRPAYREPHPERRDTEPAPETWESDSMPESLSSELHALAKQVNEMATRVQRLSLPRREELNRELNEVIGALGRFRTAVGSQRAVS